MQFLYDEIAAPPLPKLTAVLNSIAGIPPLFDAKHTPNGFNVAILPPLNAVVPLHAAPAEISVGSCWATPIEPPFHLQFMWTHELYWRAIGDGADAYYECCIKGGGASTKNYSISALREGQGFARSDLKKCMKEDACFEHAWTAFKMFRYAMFRHELRKIADSEYPAGKPYLITWRASRAVLYGLRQKWFDLGAAFVIRNLLHLGSFGQGPSGLQLQNPDGIIGSGDADHIPMPKNNAEPLPHEYTHPDFTKQEMYMPPPAKGPIPLKSKLSVSESLSECETIGAKIKGTSSTYFLVMPHGAFNLRLAARLYGVSKAGANMSLRMERASGLAITGEVAQFVNDISLFDVKGKYASAHVDGPMLKLAMAYGAVCAALQRGANAETAHASWNLFRSWCVTT